MTIRLALADDHPAVLQGLKALLALEPDIEVVACCQDGEEAVEAVRRHRPDVLVLDLRMPKLTGLQVARALQAESLPTRILILTAWQNDADLPEVLKCTGVRGVILKEVAPGLLVQAVRNAYGTSDADPA
jgi:two-component system, NarL family, response regulator DesR